MSDLSKYCVHFLGKSGLGPARGGFPISNYVAYRAVMAVGVGILYNSGDFPFFLYYWQLMYVLRYTLKVSDYHGDLSASLTSAAPLYCSSMPFHFCVTEILPWQSIPSEVLN